MRTFLQQRILMGLLFVSSASAATITLSATSSGSWVSPLYDPGVGTAARYNGVIAGYQSFSIFRSYFVFDLTGISGITDATLRLSSTGIFMGQNPDVFYLVDVDTSIANLTASDSGSVTGYHISNDLGSGTVYGAISVSDATQILQIPISAEGLDGLNAANRPFALGGSLFSISPAGVSDLGDLEAEQYLYFGSAPAKLILTTTDTTGTPEPGTAFGATGALGLAWYWQRRKQTALPKRKAALTSPQY